MLKRTTRVIAAVCAASIIATGVYVMTRSNSTNVTAAEPADKNELRVSGSASVKVKPDIATVNCGVLTMNADAKLAQEENAKIMTDVIAALKAMGIAEEDIKTSNYNMYPNYDYSTPDAKYGGAPKIASYSVNNNISVTVRDILKAGEVLDTCASKGANNAGNIQFTLSDPTKYYNEALKLAVKNATGKADVLSSAVSVKIGTPSKITEVSSYYNPPVAYAESSNFAMKDASARTPVQAGELEISAQVELVYNY